MRVIIYADDFGINHYVNQHIENAINVGKITSTTIMAGNVLIAGFGVGLSWGATVLQVTE